MSITLITFRILIAISNCSISLTKVEQRYRTKNSLEAKHLRIRTTICAWKLHISKSIRNTFHLGKRSRRQVEMFHGSTYIVKNNKNNKTMHTQLSYRIIRKATNEPVSVGIIKQVSEWLKKWVTDWVSDWLRVSDWKVSDTKVSDWLSEWVTESEWMRKWVTERADDWEWEYDWESGWLSE